MANTLPPDSSESDGPLPRAGTCRLLLPPLPGARLSSVQEICATYTQTPALAHCFFDGWGLPVQLAVRLTRAAESLVVVCKHAHGDFFWCITDVAGAAFEAGAYIAAVRPRLEADWFQAASSPLFNGRPAPATENGGAHDA